MRVRVCARRRAMSTQKAVEQAQATQQAQARQRWKIMMAWEKKCSNPETRTDPPCDTYDMLRAPKPYVDGHPPPFPNEWQRLRSLSGLPQTQASAAWAQLLAHPPSAPLVHVDHGHRLEAATAEGCQNWWTSCRSYWREQMKTADGFKKAQARYEELSEMMTTLGNEYRKPYEQEWLDLVCLLYKRCGPGGTRASVLDALEARVEGLYGLP